jgi:DNA-binding transcriptional ArsR family regulator
MVDRTLTCFRRLEKKRSLQATKWLHNEVVDSAIDKVFKALADSSRRQLLDRLRAENGQTLGELCQHLDMTRQAVTKHLRLLEEANLVVTIWRGREKLHYLNPVPINEIADRWIGKYERHRVRALHDLKQALEEGSHG